MKINPQIYREYDIRGIVDKDLTPEIAKRLGQGFGTHMARLGRMNLVVGRVGRLSSPSYREALIETSENEKTNVPSTFNLLAFMNGNHYKGCAVAERFAKGLLKAWVPPAQIHGGYFPAFKENQLNGEEIKSLLFGSTITGFVFYSQQFWINYKKNGEVTWRGPSTLAGPSSDSGKSRIEGDMICWQYQMRWWGVEYCGTLFRYSGGSYEVKTSISGVPTLDSQLFLWRNEDHGLQGCGALV